MGLSCQTNRTEEMALMCMCVYCESQYVCVKKWPLCVRVYIHDVYVHVHRFVCVHVCIVSLNMCLCEKVAFTYMTCMYMCIGLCVCMCVCSCLAIKTVLLNNLP